MKKILVFAGTTEGRQLLSQIGQGIEVHGCVATNYGKEILEATKSNIKVLEGRLNLEEMKDLITNENYDLIIDTTHPYADIVTANIKEAANYCGKKYLRVLRDSQSNSLVDEEEVVFVSDTKEAVEVLNKTSEKVLLTVGSKELETFTQVNNFKERLFARILPIGHIIDQCNTLGYEGRNLISMQGPFTEEFNIALINQLGTKVVVTKDGGKNGGFMEKFQAAQATNSKLIVIGRPLVEEGVSVLETLEILCEDYGMSKLAHCSLETKREWFPIFVNVKDKNFLVVGGGKIATRRVKTLHKFNCNIKVVAPTISDEIKALDNINIVNRVCMEEDLIGMDYVIAATSNEVLNEYICHEGKKMDLMTNVANDKDRCTFFFPGVITSGDVTVGVTAQGKDHKLAKDVTADIRKLLDRRK
ncbi:MAG: precorrin-6A reductase [Anaerovoracaceae bacterium]